MKKIKTALTAFFSALAGWLGILAIPVLMLVICNVIDYGTGIIAAKYRNEPVSSYKGLRGIIKKVCMWLLIGVGAMVDWLIIYTSSTIGITLPISFLIACIVAVWLIVNEIISILENMADIGVSIPPFLMPLVRNIKRQVEDKAAIKESEIDED